MDRCTSRETVHRNLEIFLYASPHLLPTISYKIEGNYKNNVAAAV